MNLIRLLDDNDDNEIHRLSDKHKSTVQTAMNQIEGIDFVTKYQADKEIDEWLRKSG